jgi:putative sterol carrier protein
MLARVLMVSILLALAALPARAGKHAAHTAASSQQVIEPDPTSPEELFTQMGHSFRADRARGQHLKFQFNFSDPQGGKWWITVDDGACKMGTGSITHPDVTFASTGADWVRMANGKLSGFHAFVTGRLRVSGNQFAAHKLDDIFP